MRKDDKTTPKAGKLSLCLLYLRDSVLTDLTPSVLIHEFFQSILRLQSLIYKIQEVSTNPALS